MPPKKHAAPPPPPPPATPSRFHLGSICMWILNIALLVASYFALNNWTTLNWMTGSYGYSALLEIVALLLILYLFLIGSCLLGFSGRIDRSFVHLNDTASSSSSTSSSRHQFLYFFALAIPFLILTFFTTLTLLSLGNLHATNLFVASHAEAVYAQAEVYTYDTSVSGIDVTGFIQYICSLHAFQSQCNWYVITPIGNSQVGGTTDDGAAAASSSSSSSPTAQYHFEYVDGVRESGALYDGVSYPFYRDLSLIFTSMENASTHRLTRVEIYAGVQKALDPYKKRFGWAVFAITCICFIQFTYYWILWFVYQRTAEKTKEQAKEQVPFISPTYSKV